MDKFEVYHNNWYDIIQIFKKENMILRLSENKDTGKYIINDNILLIIWNKWGKEYFYNKNNIYYQISDEDKYNLNIDISNIQTITQFERKNLFIDNKIEIYSEAPNKEYYGTYNIGRYDIITSPTRQWGSGLASPNQGRHFVSPNHPKNWMQLDTEEIFNDIMNL
jgi:hypothetical protein